ncbi:phosphatase PAP2 family protein [Myxococcota bacterium]
MGDRFGASPVELVCVSPTSTWVRALFVRIALIRRNMATQDYLCLALHVFLWLEAMSVPSTPTGILCRWSTSSLLLVTMGALLTVRGELIRSSMITAVLYRLGVFFPAVATYFELRLLLPALQPTLLDGYLVAIDRAMFGVTPSMWLERFNTLAVIEWFSFFYYSYFWILVVVLMPALFLWRGRATRELFAGATTILVVGHVGYALVPGVGPYLTLPFAEPVHGGFWWHQVLVVVENAGALMDIFPSLHTATPSFFALHAFHNRKMVPHRYTWPLLAFFALNIIIATMMLRWHYGIDIIAGLALAFVAYRLSLVVARCEERGADEPRQAVWPRFGVGPCGGYTQAVGHD